MIYLSEQGGYLPIYGWPPNMPAQYATNTQAGQDWEWQNGNIFALLATLKANTQFLLCPEAAEPMAINYNQGFGTSVNAWTGIWQGTTPVPISDFKSSEFATYTTKFVNMTTNSKPGGYRIGSYGACRWVYSNSSSTSYWGTKVSQIKNSTNVPIIFDCIWPDLSSVNNSHAPPQPPDPPPDLSGANIPGSTGDEINWRILINRHNHGINVLFADGSARWVALPDLGMLNWGPKWMKSACEWNNLPKSLTIGKEWHEIRTTNHVRMMENPSACPLRYSGVRTDSLFGFSRSGTRGRQERKTPLPRIKSDGHRLIVKCKPPYLGASGFYPWQGGA